MFNLKEREKMVSFVEQDDNFLRQIGSKEAFLWEEFLVSDYWKNWRERIKSVQSEEDAELLVYKVLELRSDILWNISYYKRKGDINRYEVDIKRLSKIREEKLQNMTSKPRNRLNDPWFNKEIDKLFGLESSELLKEKKIHGEDGYKDQTENQLTSDAQQPSNNNSLTPFLIVGILTLASLGIYGVVKKTKKIKK